MPSIRRAHCLVALSLTTLANAAPPASPWEREVLYQIFPRSFYDSNGDRIGDFNGISKKLDYVSKLGATAILLQPILKSRMYHNYFPDSYFQTDPALGTNSQFFDLVRAAHRRHLKVILDMELQYVASQHPWFVAALKHPNSPEAKCVTLRSGFYGYSDLRGYDGRTVRIATANTHEPLVLRTWQKVFRYWAAPPGRPLDGVDGFRLDHMMDDLDNKHANAGLYRRIWVPLEDSVRKVKPSVFFVAEQSDWGLGDAQFNSGKVDSVYAIPLASAFRSLDAGRIAREIQAELSTTPLGKTQLVFIEDHDMERYASVVQSDPALLRLGAVMLLASKGTPSIYYGQELGMKGRQLKGKTDGNDIPVRLAFRWSMDLDATGAARWYGPGPWNQPAFSANHDGISVEEEQGDRASLLNFYQRLIRIRRQDPALSTGSEMLEDRMPANVVAFLRSAGPENVLVAVNLGKSAGQVALPTGYGRARDLWTGALVKGSVKVQGRAFALLRLEPSKTKDLRQLVVH